MAEGRFSKDERAKSLSEALLPVDKLAEAKRTAAQVLAGAAALPGNLDGPELQLEPNVEKPEYTSVADPQDIQGILREDSAEEAAAEAEPETKESGAWIQVLPQLGDSRIDPPHGGGPV